MSSSLWNPPVKVIADSDSEVETSTGTQKLGVALDSRVIYVDTLADLQALPTSELVDGQAGEITTSGDDAGTVVWRAGDQSANTGRYGWVFPDDDPSGSGGAWQSLVDNLQLQRNILPLPVLGLKLGLPITDAGAIINAAWSAGYGVEIPPGAEYTVSTGILLGKDKANILIGFGNSTSGLKAADGFTGNIIDTEDFDTLVANSELSISNGVIAGSVLRDLYIAGNKSNFGTTVNTDIGYGIRIYGRKNQMKNLRIWQCAGVGLLTQQPPGQPSPFDSFDASKSEEVDTLIITECGYEGWVFRGPSDMFATNIRISNNGDSLNTQYDALNKLESLLFPGEGVDGLVLDNAGLEVGGGHIWNHQNGWGVKIRSDVRQVRGRFFDLISEGNWGQVDIPSDAHIEWYGEIHNQAGGPSNHRLFYDALTSSFTIGETVTGGTSGAVATIDNIIVYTSTTGRLDLTFSDQPAEEVHFVDNETITDTASGSATVHRPDAVGARPWWRDVSSLGTIASLKINQQSGFNDGSAMAEVYGQLHQYTMKMQSENNRYGHGLVTNCSKSQVRLIAGGRARQNFEGADSAGLFVGSATKSCKIDAQVFSCEQNVFFEGDANGCVFNITSDAPITDHMNGLDNLDASTYWKSNLTATDSGSTTWENKIFAIDDSVDLSSTAVQSITFNHGQVRAIGVSDVNAVLSRIPASGTWPAVDIPPFIQSVTSTQVTVRLQFAAGGDGTGRLTLYSTRN